MSERDRNSKDKRKIFTIPYISAVWSVYRTYGRLVGSEGVSVCLLFSSVSVASGVAYYGVACHGRIDTDKFITNKYGKVRDNTHIKRSFMEKYHILVVLCTKTIKQ